MQAAQRQVLLLVFLLPGKAIAEALGIVSDLRYLRRGNKGSLCHDIHESTSPGLLHHLMARGNNNQKVFWSDQEVF